MLKTKTEIEKEILKEKEKIFIIILKPSNNKLKILNRQLHEWLSLAVKNFPFVVLQIKENSDIKKLISAYLKNFEYTIVLYSYTPLITSETIDSIADYIIYKKINACKLSVGMAFKNSYFLQDKFEYDNIYLQNENDFYIVENIKQCNVAKNIIIQRINNYHIERGVNILNSNTVIIEPDVNIQSDVEICQNNTILGKTILRNNVILKENNVIENSLIESGVGISNSIVKNCKIGKNSLILPFCSLENVVVGENCTIASHNVLKDCKITNNSKI